MAQINSFERLSMERHTAHDPISATYTAFDLNGDKYLQIDTYGRETRDVPGKKSQSIQLNERSARELVIILKDHFGI